MSLALGIAGAFGPVVVLQKPRSMSSLDGATKQASRRDTRRLQRIRRWYIPPCRKGAHRLHGAGVVAQAFQPVRCLASWKQQREKRDPVSLFVHRSIAQGAKPNAVYLTRSDLSLQSRWGKITQFGQGALSSEGAAGRSPRWSGRRSASDPVRGIWGTFKITRSLEEAAPRMGAASSRLLTPGDTTPDSAAPRKRVTAASGATSCRSFGAQRTLCPDPGYECPIVVP